MRLGAMLSRARLISPQQIAEYELKARDRQQTLLESLIEHAIVSSETLRDWISELSQYPVYTGQFPTYLPPRFKNYFEQWQSHHAIPIEDGQERPLIVIADPFDSHRLNALSQTLGYAPRLAVGDYLEIKKVLHEWEKLNTHTTENTFITIQNNDDSGGPVAHFINQLLYYAHSQSASDIHLEPQANTLRIRLRIDGRLHPYHSPENKWRDGLITRLKLLARLNISERRIPQDGKFTHTLKTASDSIYFDCRISTLPILYGEKIVIRLLDRQHQQFNFSHLGYTEYQQNLLKHSLNKEQGLILATGPTGSGKTLSLYACLHHLNRAERNIATVEDPVEIEIPGLNQVNIHEKAGLNFAVALRAFLRQDPDVIMVGEIRDAETAEIAIKAAQTGHQVLSTLHTADAPSAIIRLMHMGINAYHLAGTIELIMAQRLLPTLCSFCKKAVPIKQILDYAKKTGLPPDLLIRLNKQIHQHSSVYSPVGCEKCGGTGFKGRTGIFQFLSLSNELHDAIAMGASRPVITQLAQQQGMLTLAEAGLDTALTGTLAFENLHVLV
jgi:type IV pilus assembly protein PilB